MDSITGFPTTLNLEENKVKNLRYGENPHQQAALYGSFLDYFDQLQGKELSYNNIIDISAAAYLIGIRASHRCHPQAYQSLWSSQCR